MANDPNQDLKNQLGNEYDIYSSLKDKFQGFNKDGHAVFKDEAGTTSFDKTDFSKMNAQLQKDFGNKSYEDTFNQNQYEDISKQGNKFQGFAGDQAVFRNEKGDLENFGNQGGFAEFLKKQQSGNTFDMAKQGQSQRSSQDYAANLGFLGTKQGTQQKTGSGFTGYNPQQKLNNTAKRMINPSVAAEDSIPSENPNIPSPGSVLPKSQGGIGSFEDFLAKRVKKPTPLSNEPEPTPQAPAKQAPPTVGQVATGVAKDAAGTELRSQKDSAVAGLQNQYGAQAKALLPADPTGGALSQAMDYKNLASGNISQNIQNLAMQKAKQAAGNQAEDYLRANDPTGGALSSAAQYANLLKGGNVVQNAQNIALDQGKQAAVNSALSSVPGAGAYSGAVLGGVKALTGGGNSSDKGQALGEGAARAALASTGIGALANPELLQAGAGLTDKLGNKLGTAGVLLKPTSMGLDLGAQALNTGIKGAGAQGATTARAFSAANEGLKSIAHGNIEEGLKGLGSGAAKAAVETFLKNPATIAKGVGNLGKAALSKLQNIGGSVGKAISSIFCFTPDTEILMANGKYKKIKQIKLHDEIMLGGKVTAIGTSTSDDIYLYDGVEVSGGHTLYEDGVWLRVRDSKYAVKVDVKEMLVYPMATENHLIVTKGQVWADMEEVDDTYNKTDEDILKELNSQKHANSMINIFLKSYFKKKK